MILTSLEFDHADIFNSINDIKDQFIPVIQNLPGKFIYSDHYQAIQDLRQFRQSKEENNIALMNKHAGPIILKSDSSGTTFELEVNKDGHKEIFKTNIVGDHNIWNLSFVIRLAVELNYPILTYRDQVLMNLEMVKRRQEVRGNYKGMVVVDDFAHHPTAVKVTIDSIRIKYPEKKIAVILEPHSATARTELFQHEFPLSLALCDYVIFAQSSRHNSTGVHKSLDFKKMGEELKEKSVLSDVSINFETLWPLVQNCVGKYDVLLVLSNGTCQGLWENPQFLNDLKK